MPEPTFKVKERKDYLKLKQMETWKEASSGKKPNFSRVVQVSVYEYNKPENINSRKEKI